MQSLNSLFHRVAESKASSTLFADDSVSCSGDEALQVVKAVAGGFSHLQIDKGDRIAFLCDNSVSYVLSFFACQHLGIIPCALHVRTTVNDIARALQWLNASALVINSQYSKLAVEALQLGNFSIPLIILDNQNTAVEQKITTYAELIDAGIDKTVQQPASVDDAAMIILSSGTTAEPKGVVHSQRTLYASAMAGKKVFGKIAPGDSTIIAMAPSFAAWNHVLFPFLAQQAKIVFIRSFDADLYINTIEKEKITHAALVPTAWRRVLSKIDEKNIPASLRNIFFSGEPATADFINKIKTVLPNVNVRTAYLSSEGGDASACVADNNLLSSGKLSVGKPVAGAELRIVDPDGGINDKVRQGKTGEIVIKSESLALGYWKNSPLTTERFVSGWWRSSDLGQLDKEGNLSICGRNDNLIISGGLKVHAEEIEAALMKHEAIEQAAVVGQPDADWGQRVEAFVMTSTKISKEDILAFCREQSLLPSFKLPKAIHFRDKLPTGATGKLYRRALLEDAT